MAGRSGKINIMVLVIAGILIAAGILAVYILLQKKQPDIQEVAKLNPDHYAVYRVLATAGGATKNATLIYAKKGDDFVMAAVSDQGKNRVIAIGGKAYYCTQPPGAAWRCVQISMDRAKQYNMKYLLDNLKDIQPLAPETVAGVYSYCWGGTLPSAQGMSSKAVICMSPQGVVTRIVTEVKMGGQTVQRVEVSLTKLSWSVPQDLFELPAQPQGQ